MAHQLGFAGPTQRFETWNVNPEDVRLCSSFARRDMAHMIISKISDYIFSSVPEVQFPGLPQLTEDAREYFTTNVIRPCMDTLFQVLGVGYVVTQTVWNGHVPTLRIIDPNTYALQYLFDKETRQQRWIVLPFDVIRHRPDTNVYDHDFQKHYRLYVFNQPVSMTTSSNSLAPDASGMLTSPTRAILDRAQVLSTRMQLDLIADSERANPRVYVTRSAESVQPSQMFQMPLTSLGTGAQMQTDYQQFMAHVQRQTDIEVAQQTDAERTVHMMQLSQDEANEDRARFHMFGVPSLHMSRNGTLRNTMALPAGVSVHAAPSVSLNARIIEYTEQFVTFMCLTYGFVPSAVFPSGSVKGHELQLDESLRAGLNRQRTAMERIITSEVLAMMTHLLTAPCYGTKFLFGKHKVAHKARRHKRVLRMRRQRRRLRRESRTRANAEGAVEIQAPNGMNGSSGKPRSTTLTTTTYRAAGRLARATETDSDSDSSYASDWSHNGMEPRDDTDDDKENGIDDLAERTLRKLLPSLDEIADIEQSGDPMTPEQAQDFLRNLKVEILFAPQMQTSTVLNLFNHGMLPLKHATRVLSEIYGMDLDEFSTPEEYERFISEQARAQSRAKVIEMEAAARLGTKPRTSSSSVAEASKELPADDKRSSEHKRRLRERDANKPPKGRR